MTNATVAVHRPADRRVIRDRHSFEFLFEMLFRPGNWAVVHHCTVFLVPPGQKEPALEGALGSFCLAATAPGTPRKRSMYALVMPSSVRASWP